MRTSRYRIMAVGLGFAALALSGMGCELVTAPDRDQIPGEGGGGAGGEGGTGGTGGTTGECAVAEDCPETGNECLARACIDAQCVPEPVAADTEVSQQSAGDCLVQVCDGNGSITAKADDTDLPVDGKECTDDVCTSGVPSNPNKPEGTGCGAGGMLYCNDAGSCVGCLTDGDCGSATDCATPTCAAGTMCETIFVAPGTPVPTQTAGDCLEVQCNGIGGTKTENDDSDVEDDGNDCTLDVCSAGVGSHPNAPSGATCDDGGQKCDGGGVCVGCLNGGDCPSGVCVAQVCQPPACDDGVKNGDETDVDCGGSCSRCDDGKLCALAADCQSLVCTGNVCIPAACDDGVENGNETDTDCGGGSCPACATGGACDDNADCIGNLCTADVCAPTCTDTEQNGNETDVDCGGSCATKCGFTKGCSVNGDCLGNVCTGGACAASCNDAVKNGDETAVDCGGGTCPGCATGSACNANGDCLSGVCTGNVCVSACPNGTVNAGEQCDDNNGANGDGCSSTCTCEPTQVVLVDTNPNLAIPDDGYDGTLASMACVDVVLTAQCSIVSASVTVAMSHTWIGDLTIKLVHPDNTVVTLVSRPGELESGDDGNDGSTGGDSSNLVTTHPITFQTGAATSAEDMGATLGTAGNVCQNDAICTFAPNAGSAPPGDLTSLVGKPANGTWKLCAADSVSFDTGVIDKVTITVNQ